MTTKNETTRQFSVAPKYAARELRDKWLGRLVYSSADAQLRLEEQRPPGMEPREITAIFHDREFDQFVAYSRGHHRANSAESLDRLLHSLAVR